MYICSVSNIIKMLIHFLIGYNKVSLVVLLAGTSVQVKNLKQWSMKNTMYACINTLVLCCTDKASCFHLSEWNVEVVNSRGIQKVEYVLQFLENTGSIATHQMLCWKLKHSKIPSIQVKRQCLRSINISNAILNLPCLLFQRTARGFSRNHTPKYQGCSFGEDHRTRTDLDHRYSVISSQHSQASTLHELHHVEMSIPLLLHKHGKKGLHHWDQNDLQLYRA